MAAFVAEGGFSPFKVNFSALLTGEHLPPPVAWFGPHDIANLSLGIFNYVLNVSGVLKELDMPELDAFRNRFMKSMLGMPDGHDLKLPAFLDRARRRIEAAKPVMTCKVADILNTRHTRFRVKMKSWLLHESVETLEQRLIKVPFRVADDRRFTGSVGSAATNKQLGSELESATTSAPSPQQQLGGQDLSKDLAPEAAECTQLWPQCEDVIMKPYNQGHCGSCWVFSALGSAESRMCIATSGAFSGAAASLSRSYGTSCAVDWDGCEGGWPHQLYDFIEKQSGIPTSSCVPYFGGTDYENHWHASMSSPSCPSECTSSGYGRHMDDDLYRPLGIGNYRVVMHPDAKGLEEMKVALYSSGPLPFSIAANYEFMAYHDGVFDAACGESANHAVQAIGYGRDYISGLNSWGKEWGEAGRFKVALCMVYHYVVPGDITAEDYPEPLVTLVNGSDVAASLTGEALDVAGEY